MYKAIDLAKYVVSKCSEEKHPISNLHLQKILYYIQKDYLSKNSIAFHEDIEAWQFGPVVPDVYYYFCSYGAMNIDFQYDRICVDSIIDEIIKIKRDLNPWDLVNDTHMRGGAWDSVYNQGSGNHQVIPTNLIKEKG